MKRNVLIFGLIAGVISSAWFFGHVILGVNVDFENAELYGYLTMLLAFSMIVVGVKKQRDLNDGAITFGKAFKTGLFITLIASTFYVAAWLIYYYTSDTDFIAQYSQHIVEEMKESGATQAAIDQQMKDMKMFEGLLRNPFFNAVMTYMEILPVGLLVSLITALIMKRKPKAQLS